MPLPMELKSWQRSWGQVLSLPVHGVGGLDPALDKVARVVQVLLSVKGGTEWSSALGKWCWLDAENRRLKRCPDVCPC